jgi:hypothetical protein
MDGITVMPQALLPLSDFIHHYPCRRCTEFLSIHLAIPWVPLGVPQSHLSHDTLKSSQLTPVLAIFGLLLNEREDYRMNSLLLTSHKQAALLGHCLHQVSRLCYTMPGCEWRHSGPDKHPLDTTADPEDAMWSRRISQPSPTQLLDSQYHES